MATEVLVPPLGQTVDTMTLVTWYKNEGERVAQGDPLFAIETDKATLDVEAPASGMLRQVTAQPGDEVKVLSAIALIAAPDETVESPQRPSSPPPVMQDASSFLLGREKRERDRGDKDHRIFISPRARRLAEEHNIPLTALPATGPEGAIVERDVRAYLDTQTVPSTSLRTGPSTLLPSATLETGRTSPPITPVARRMAEEAGLDWRSLTGTSPGGRITRDDVAKALEAAPWAAETAPVTTEINEVVEAMPLRSVRAVIAGRMARSVTTTAHVTLTAEADATALVELRHQLIQDGVQVSYNDLFLYVLGRVLREYPQLNTSLEGDTIKVWRRIHIGLAVDTDRGLLVPVVRDIDQKGLLQLAEETQSLIERAQTGQCAPDELSGGTFTLTNLGMFGIDAFTPLINLPECAILGVGRIKRQPVMVGEEVVGRQMVWLSLTFDHRLVDGGPAARFLQRVVQLVERPHLLIT
ncbi:MAG: 2-oxo acid dehydrogenase subunit E2 [Anaerolineales bacterium]|nr:MAG: 2-oxo acid dehydrogenase subunit E2 [Anaerolineales bacterium]